MAAATMTIGVAVAAAMRAVFVVSAGGIVVDVVVVDGIGQRVKPSKLHSALVHTGVFLAASAKSKSPQQGRRAVAWVQMSSFQPFPPTGEQ